MLALPAETRPRDDLAAAEAMRDDPLLQNDKAMRELADDEIHAATSRLDRLEAELLAQLVPKDVRDEGGLYLEVRAGAGGDEAAIFAGENARATLVRRRSWTGGSIEAMWRSFATGLAEEYVCQSAVASQTSSKRDSR